jgi:uncharacterized membrane protein YccC
LLRATKHPNAHSNPRACTVRPDFRLSKRKAAQFSRSHRETRHFARKIKKIQIHATTRRKDATVQSAARRAHRIAKYQYRIQKHKERERERERERRMCLCAPGTACFFSLLNRFCGFYEERTALFLGENWLQKKKHVWTKLGTLRSALIYHSTLHSFTRRERERKNERA